MTTKRNGYGQIKRHTPNRDFRRKHAHGAFRRMASGGVESLGGISHRIANAIRRWFL